MSGYPTAVFGSSAYTSSGNNTNAVITLAGQTGYGWCLAGLVWSYNTNPTGGRITITDNGTTVFDVDITTSGASFFPFDPALECSLGNTMVITLYAGGANVIGKINLLGVRLKPQ